MISFQLKVARRDVLPVAGSALVVRVVQAAKADDRLIWQRRRFRCPGKIACHPAAVLRRFSQKIPVDAYE